MPLEAFTGRAKATSASLSAHPHPSPTDGLKARYEVRSFSGTATEFDTEPLRDRDDADKIVYGRMVLPRTVPEFRTEFELSNHLLEAENDVRSILSRLHELIIRAHNDDSSSKPIRMGHLKVVDVVEVQLLSMLDFDELTHHNQLEPVNVNDDVEHMLKDPGHSSQDLTKGIKHLDPSSANRVVQQDNAPEAEEKSTSPAISQAGSPKPLPKQATQIRYTSAATVRKCNRTDSNSTAEKMIAAGCRNPSVPIEFRKPTSSTLRDTKPSSPDAKDEPADTFEEDVPCSESAERSPGGDCGSS
jgi:hypothetical protein